MLIYAQVWLPLACLAGLLSCGLFAASPAVDSPAARVFWAFQPPLDPLLPKVKYKSWPESSLDHFILAKLEEKQLQPAPPADQRTLIRRATFALTGLPPTLEEIDAYLADKSSEAFTRVVDRLLSSPQYGERWGRHWLDVARYADSNGLDENVAHGNAWRYRDYVVRAFNDDKPYDQFIIEQIAGDLLPPAETFSQKQERLTALGFLSIGPKVLAEPDQKKMEMDIIDEQVDTLGRAFMGLTLGCARCHDHKFDPIPTEDYYGLAGIFKSSKTMDDFKIVAKWHELSLATPEEIAAKDAYEKNLAAHKSGVTNLINDANEKLVAAGRARTADYLAAAVKLPESASTNEVELLAESEKLNPAFLRQWRQFLAKQETNSFFQPWQEFFKNPRASETVAADERGSTRREEAPSFKSEIRNPKSEIDQILLTPGATNSMADPKFEGARKTLFDLKGPFGVPTKPENYYAKATTNELKRLREAIAELEKNAPELPSTMGVEDGEVADLPVHIRGSHLTLGKVAARRFPQVLSKSGAPAISPKQSGRLELARWLASPEHPLTARVMVNRIWRWHFGQGIVPTPDNFGQLGERPVNQPLLDWLAHRFIESGWSIKAMHRLILNSATWQQRSSVTVISKSVISNQSSARRSWGSQHRGNDGRFLKTDPLNTDSLITDSLITNHRQRAHALDADNRLLSHANLRRLEAEEIRDSLLAVSGLLDLTMGGKTIPLKNREFVFNHTSQDATTYNNHRRSLYQPVIRNHVYDAFELFDFPDPAQETGHRSTTTIPSQALFFLNSDLMQQAAEKLASDLLADAKLGDAGRIGIIYLKAYGRPATKLEINQALAFVVRYEKLLEDKFVEVPPRRPQAWAAFCQMILSANEFVHLK